MSLLLNFSSDCLQPMGPNRGDSSDILLQIIFHVQLNLSDQVKKVKVMRMEIKSREHEYMITEDRLYSDESELETKEDDLYQAFKLDLSNNESQLSSTDISSLAPEKPNTDKQPPPAIHKNSLSTRCTNAHSDRRV